MAYPAPDSWLVLRTRSRHENRVLLCLQQKRIRAYVPKYNSMSRRPDRVPTVEMPLFPGYVFVQPNADQFEAIHYIRGSCGLVLSGMRPAAMPALELEAVRKMISSGAPLAVVPELARGRRAVVVEGPIAGVRGEMIRVSSQCHLVINAVVVGYSVSVPVDSNKIRVL